MDNAKQCRMCKVFKPLTEFYLRKDSGRYRLDCKLCQQYKQQLKYAPHPRKLKYSSEEERKEAAKRRTKEWYKNNKEKAKEYSKNYRNLEDKKSLIKSRRQRNAELHPLWWRWKKKHDRSIRRSREYNAGELYLSAIVVLENYNFSIFKTSSLCCESCSSLINDNNYHLDHILPISKNGTNKLGNLSIMCSKCNLSKGSKLLEEWNPSLIEYFRNRKI